MLSLSLPRRRRTRAWLVLAGLLAALTSSCQLAKAAVDVPTKILSGPAKPAPVPSNVVQVGVMRFADTFAARITQSARDFAQNAGTPEAYIQAMNWTVGQCTAAFTIATGANPNANMLDMLVLVTLGRIVHEEHFMQVWGEADRPMLAAFQELEEELWTVARQLLSPAQQEAVRQTLKEWREKNPDMAVTAFVKLPAFQDVLAARGCIVRGRTEAALRHHRLRRHRDAPRHGRERAHLADRDARHEPAPGAAPGERGRRARRAHDRPRLRARPRVWSDPHRRRGLRRAARALDLGALGGHEIRREVRELTSMRVACIPARSRDLAVGIEEDRER